MVVTLKLISTAVCYQDGLAPPKVLACLCSSCKRVALAFGGHPCFDRVVACAVRRPVLARAAWLQDSAILDWSLHGIYLGVENACRGCLFGVL